jgi:hypothetical protein
VISKSGYRVSVLREGFTVGDQSLVGCRIMLRRPITVHTEPPAQLVLSVGIKLLEMGLC